MAASFDANLQDNSIEKMRENMKAAKAAVDKASSVLNTNIENINKANEEKLALERVLEKRIEEEERRGAIEKEDKRQADEEKWLNSAEGRGYTQITLRNPTQEEMLYNIIGPEDRRLTIRAGNPKHLP